VRCSREAWRGPARAAAARHAWARGGCTGYAELPRGFDPCNSYRLKLDAAFINFEPFVFGIVLGIARDPGPLRKQPTEGYRALDAFASGGIRSNDNRKGPLLAQLGARA